MENLFIGLAVMFGLIGMGFLLDVIGNDGEAIANIFRAIRGKK